MKYVEAFLEEFRKTPIFTMADVEKFLISKGSTKAYPKIFTRLMLDGGRAFKISRGFYTLYKDAEVVGFPFYPFYYGLGFALTKHGLWKQQANPYVITTRDIRRGIRNALGFNFAISRVSRKMFFGYYYAKGSNFYYPVSDLEKTLIDCIYFRFNLEDYVYSDIFSRLDRRKIAGYLKKCNRRVGIKYGRLEATFATRF